MDQELTPISYLALGDSITEGIGAISPEHNFVTQYFRQLKCSDQCQLRNWGISGMRTKELLDLIHNPGLTRVFPRVTHISISIGGCDFIEMYESGPVTHPRVAITIKKVLNHSKEILRSIRQKSPQAKIQTLGFYMPLPAYDYEGKGASRIVQLTNYYYTNICRKYQVELVNPFKEFYQRKDFFSDEVHPNQEGYNRLAQLFIQTISSSPLKSF
ncbi:SGNH/GDSL hydrolase family protein [Hazenella coriacea]|uniref:Lysophospholipase L1-like esterase n=1 Tax=Hazenella coriacea TaxID=1179467 RepID=A0A4R3L9W3_9BACL|nr:GDSL-type esterase/lipase family protein [Hazenella coriacea]TCS95024.1 lysophospholipase L1-like esterase [Hazenella coriacea]